MPEGNVGLYHPELNAQGAENVRFCVGPTTNPLGYPVILFREFRVKPVEVLGVLERWQVASLFLCWNSTKRFRVCRSWGLKFGMTNCVNLWTLSVLGQESF